MAIYDDSHMPVESWTVPVVIIASHKRGGRTFLLKDTRVTVTTSIRGSGPEVLALVRSVICAAVSETKTCPR